MENLLDMDEEPEKNDEDSVGSDGEECKVIGGGEVNSSAPEKKVTMAEIE